MSDPMIRAFWQAKRTSGGLAERKALEPICTSLLVHNNKQAVQHAQKMLRIRPYNPPVQALLAVALIRLGEFDIALSTVDEVARDVKGAGKALADANMLSLCAAVYEQCPGHKPQSLAMWENASRLHPNNIDLAYGAHSYFVRIGAYRAAEEAARRTIDAKEGTHARVPSAYINLLWDYIAAVVIQAGDLYNPGGKTRLYSANSPPTPQAVYQSLQDALSHINPSGLSPSKTTPPSSDALKELDVEVCLTAHTFYLALRVLKYLADIPEDIKLDLKPDEVRCTLLKILQSPRGLDFCKKDLQIDLFRRDAILTYGKAKEWKVLFEIMMNKLENGDPNWATILTAIQAAYGIATGSSSILGQDQIGRLTEGQLQAAPDTWWTSAASADNQRLEPLIRLKKPLEQLGADDSLSKKDRGYTLGLLKMAVWYNTQGQGPLPNLIITYIKRHANKACCFPDLQDYLPLLSVSGRQTLISWLNETYSLDTVNTETLQALECSMTAEKIRRYLQRTYGTVEEEVERGHRLAKAYFSALHFGKDLIATDLQPQDDFALLAAQCYLGAWEVSERMPQYLELAIGVLEFAIRKSKYKYQIRVLLICLYRWAGASSLALDHYKIMDIKQIQYDTLSHWALERACTFPTETPNNKSRTRVEILDERLADDYDDILENTVAWYVQGDQETDSSLSNAWSREAYCLLEDYTVFKDRLSHSVSRAVIEMGATRTASLYEGLALEQVPIRMIIEKLAFNPEVLHDNRDYSILPNYQPAEQTSILKQTAMGPPADQAWVKQVARLYLIFLDSSPQALAKLELGSTPPDTCTELEVRLVEWTVPVADWLSGKSAKVEDAVILEYIKNCHADLMQRDVTQPVSLLVHIAQLALEAYALLDLAFKAKSASPGEFNNIKQFKQIRQSSKSSMKAISSRLKVLNEDLVRSYKGRIKLEPLLPLKQFEPVSEDFLIGVATALLESKKSTLLQLAHSITKRISGP